MAEEIEAGICGSSWWNSSRHALAASPGFNDHMAGSFGCPNDMVDMKAIASSRSSCGETININSAHLEVSDDDDVHSNSVGYDQYREDVDLEKPHGSPRPSVLIHSTLQMLGFGLSSSTVLPSDFNQALLLGRNDSMLQEHMGDTNKLNYPNEDSPSIINGFKPLNQEFSLEQLGSSSSSGFPISSSSSSSAANSYGFPPTLLQSLYDPEVPQPQQSLFNNSSNNNHFSNQLLLPPSPTSACWPPRYSPSSCLRPSSLPKQLQPAGGAGGGRGGGGGGGSLHFSNNVNTPFWNSPPSELRSNSSHFSSSQSQYAPPPSSTFHEQKPNNSHNNFTSKGSGNEDAQDSSSSIVKKSGSSSSGCESVFKRARIETPSPLPTFKVRKEKLGDRITALQQLVSPFGKTDTASVLHEAIEYIKFLHDQVSVLSTPYMKNGGPMQHQQGSDHKRKEVEGARQDLQSRGLCLVPISSTFPVANETTADFWTPTFGATFR